ncbi:hypothetical protein L249_4417 [Ophiocordyceps polyrhachis-furcata BCC 54312]|uniref:Uncharacterized protein n=1 Tax=Ophiocordyceps polyrhachis-furcata BCC 54312 TaxID=1330021 RepID=A0A367L7M9_9HYPO|nr:hypothetical protein L249_4417 [Ophiocordyceps polyrhachis-furcata BCC 54312]
MATRSAVEAPRDPTLDQDHVRGRRRSRSSTRNSIQALRCDESSTLRGRSPRRASSPLGSVASPLRRHSRREHCPSRAADPSSLVRRRRQRSRSRGGWRRDRDLVHSTDLPSGLRNELRLSSDELLLRPPKDGDAINDDSGGNNKRHNEMA